MNAAISNQWLSDVLTQIKVNLLGSTPAAPTVHLVSAPFTPTPLSDYTTFTEATFDGYAAKTVTSWGTEHLDPLGQYIMTNANVLAWTPTGNTTSNTIYGYYLLASNGDQVQAEVFAAPVLLHGVGTTLDLVIVIGEAPSKTTCVVLP